MTISHHFLISGQDWSTDIEDLRFHFATETPSYLYFLSVFYSNYEITDDGLEFSGLSNSSSFDQKDTVRYFFVDPNDLDDFTGSDTVNTVLVNSAAYRVSFSDVIPAGFSEDEDGEVQLINHQGDSAGTLSRGFFPDTTDEAGDIVINYLDPGYDELAPGESGFWLHLHELGHAIGGFNHSDGSEYDSMKYTMMSYDTYGGVYASGLQLLDIAALQDTYGTTNAGTRSGDTTYALGQGLGFYGASADDAFLYTIWDGGGTDTIDVSAFNVGSQIDLREGRFSSIGKDAFGSAWALDGTGSESDPGNVAIAYGTVIENAVGTDYVDFIIGNDGSNEIDGGSGNDFIYGSKGDDILDGGDDTDTVSYSGYYGYVVIDLDDGDGTIEKYDGQRNDAGSPDNEDNFSSIEKFVFGTYAGILNGTSGDDVIDVEGDGEVNAGAGEDTITAGVGNQVLRGGADGDHYIIDASSYTGVKYIIDGGGDAASDTVTITGVTDAADIKLLQFWDHLLVYDTSGGIFSMVAMFVDYFSGLVEFIDTLEIDDGAVTNIDLADLDSADLSNDFEELMAVLDYFNTLWNTVASVIWDPLVIDLDNDGIATDARAVSQYFDLDGDGFAEAVGWAGKDDGFLVRDLNENGRIDDGTELFGDETTDGFTALAAFDTNEDGVINSGDAVWSDLLVWQDKNHDGQTQSDELLSLASLNITGIDVENITQTSIATSAGTITQTGTVTTTTGTLAAGNYSFYVDDQNTRYALDYDFDLRAAYLPNARGVANMPDLHIAISLDNDEEDPDSLLSLMREIASYGFPDVFANYSAIKDIVQEVMFRWAGAENTSGRGPYVEDARLVEFLEQYLGVPFFDHNLHTEEGMPGKS